MYGSNSLQHSPPQLGAQSPYDGYSSYGNPSPYSTDSTGRSPPQVDQIQVNMGSYSVQDNMHLFASQNYMTPMETSTAQCLTNQNFTFNPQNIKQEAYTYDAHYYSNPSQTHLQSNNVTRNESYVSQAKARYTSVAIGGKPFQHSHKKSTQEDVAIKGISKWLQQGRTPVH